MVLWWEEWFRVAHRATIKAELHGKGSSHWWIQAWSHRGWQQGSLCYCVEGAHWGTVTYNQAKNDWHRPRAQRVRETFPLSHKGQTRLPCSLNSQRSPGAAGSNLSLGQQFISKGIQVSADCSFKAHLNESTAFTAVAVTIHKHIYTYRWYIRYLLKIPPRQWNVLLLCLDASQGARATSPEVGNFLGFCL